MWQKTGKVSIIRGPAAGSGALHEAGLCGAFFEREFHVPGKLRRRLGKCGPGEMKSAPAQIFGFGRDRPDGMPGLLSGLAAQTSVSFGSRTCAMGTTTGPTRRQSDFRDRPSRVSLKKDKSQEDRAVFAEWIDRLPGSRRSLSRACLFAEKAGVLGMSLPQVTVVGSKGKGTAAIYASAVLQAAGLRTGTITSPGLRSNRERIRFEGEAIPAPDWEALLDFLENIRKKLPRHASHEYLSPSGLFLMGGLRWLLDKGVEAVVVEAGRGGRSDEVALFPAPVVAVTSIFEEHLGELGANLREIAEEKAGILGSSTRVLATLPQCRVVTQVLHRVAKQHNVAIRGPELDDFSTFSDLLPPGLSRDNALLGMTAGASLLRQKKIAFPAPDVLSGFLQGVLLPGRLSVHSTETATFVTDAAINGAGAIAARAWTRSHFGRDPDRVLVCQPDGKDMRGLLKGVEGLALQLVTLPFSHLSWETAAKHGAAVPFSADLVQQASGLILVLGTVYFVGEVLDVLNVNCDRLFFAGQSSSLAAQSP